MTFFLVYFGVFLLVSAIKNQYFLRLSIDLIVAFILASICYMITILYVSFPKDQERRRKYLSRTRNERLQLTMFELEHSKLQERLHLLTWVFVMAITGIFILGVYRVFYAIPPEISNEPLFWNYMAPVILWPILITVGFFAGVIYQIMRSMDDITEAIKDFGTQNF